MLFQAGTATATLRSRCFSPVARRRPKWPPTAAPWTIITKLILTNTYENKTHATQSRNPANDATARRGSAFTRRLRCRHCSIHGQPAPRAFWLVCRLPPPDQHAELHAGAGRPSRKRVQTGPEQSKTSAGHRQAGSSSAYLSGQAPEGDHDTIEGGKRQNGCGLFRQIEA